MSAESSSSLLSTMLASVTAGLAGTMVYWYLKNVPTDSRADEPKKHATDVILHVEVPHDAVAYLIGRDGSRLKGVENNTNTVISFIDPGGPSRLCVIRGTNQEGVQLAREELINLVEDHAKLETSEIGVSQRIIELLQSDDNKKLREISAASKAKVYIYTIREKPNSLLVRGTFVQINKVRNLLKQLIDEEDVLENKLVTPTSALAKSWSVSSALSSAPVEMPNTKKFSTSQMTELLEATSSDGYCEVMISMVESPMKFFVQKAGVKSKELDRLIEDMTAVYSDSTEPVGSLSTLEVGHLVALHLPDDDCWYRAKIVSVDWNSECRDQSVVNGFMLDFGDVVSVPITSVAQLLAEHLNRLPFQAIECRLAHVKSLGEHEWSKAAIEAFETMTYCALWKIVMARVESYARVGDNEHFVPCVKIIDTNTEQDVDLSRELVRLGFATLLTSS